MSEELKRDLAFGHIIFSNSTIDEDTKKGIDGHIGEMKIATRKYRIPLAKYNAISIRKRRYSKSEFDKMLNGEYEPVLYIFEYIDFYVICRVQDIVTCLKNNLYIEKLNKDNVTSGCYIEICLLPTLVIPKVNNE